MLAGPLAQRTNEQWLVDLAHAGPSREAALGDLRHILIGGLHQGILRRVRGTRSEFSGYAEDFAQDALLKIVDKLDTFHGESQFTTWAHRIAVRVALTELRRKRWRDVSLEAMVGSEDDPREIDLPDPVAGPETETARRQLIELLHRYINTELSTKQRRALMAVSINGLPLEIIAERMGSTRNAMYKLLHDARKRLKQKMEADGFTAESIMGLLE